MKRKDIVSNLLKEGFSEKTLANLSDKQLIVLAGRVLSEQIMAPVTNVSQTDLPTQTALKQQKKPFATYESEIKEDTKTDKKEDINTLIKKLKFKIEHEKDKKKIVDYKKLMADAEKLKTKKPENVPQEVEEGFKNKTEWLKSKGIIKGNSKKEETDEDSEIMDEPKNEKETEKKDKCETKDGGSEYKKRVSSKDFESFSLNEWVNNVVGKNVHPFTSKDEIMSLINHKLMEQKHQEAPSPSDPDIEVEPGKREAPGIDPDDPFRDPHPGIDPGPKAKKKKEKISAEDAKKKIIELLKKEL